MSRTLIAAVIFLQLVAFPSASADTCLYSDDDSWHHETDYSHQEAYWRYCTGYVGERDSGVLVCVAYTTYEYDGYHYLPDQEPYHVHEEDTTENFCHWIPPATPP